MSVAWRKSSRSGDVGNCVEVALSETAVAVRDSKNPRGGHLVVPRVAFAQLIDGIKGGAFARR